MADTEGCGDAAAESQEGGNNTRGAGARGAPHRGAARRVTFPEDDANLVTGYLEPVNPCQHVEEIGCDELIESYVASCKKHNTEPITCLVEQIRELGVVGGSRKGRLSLRGTPLLPPACEALEAVLRRARFFRIDVTDCQLTDDTAGALFDMVEYYESTIELDISENKNFGYLGWQACSKMVNKSQCLEQLETRDTSLSESTAPVLGKALRPPCMLRCLHLQRSHLTGRPLLNLASALRQNKSVRELHLGDNQLLPEDAQHLATLLKSNAFLQLLDVSNNEIQDVGMEVLAEALEEQSSKLCSSSGSSPDSSLSSPQTPSSSSSSQERGLAALILWNNNLTRNSGHHFSRALSRCKSLEVLNVGQNPLGGEAVNRMRGALQKNRSLLSLGMQSSRLGAEAAVALAEVIEDNPVIQRIDLRDNRLQAAGLLALVTALRKNLTVTRIDLDDAPPATNGLDQPLEEALLVSEIRSLCQRNDSHGSAGVSPSGSEVELSAQRRRAASYALRKISLTCQTMLPPPPPPPQPPRALSPPRAPHSRLRSPLPSPVPSPMSSPTPSPSHQVRQSSSSSASRSRFQVSRVSPAVKVDFSQHAKSPAYLPSEAATPHKQSSRFKVVQVNYEGSMPPKISVQAPEEAKQSANTSVHDAASQTVKLPNSRFSIVRYVQVPKAEASESGAEDRNLKHMEDLQQDLGHLYDEFKDLSDRTKLVKRKSSDCLENITNVDSSPTTVAIKKNKSESSLDSPDLEVSRLMMAKRGYDSGSSLDISGSSVESLSTLEIKHKTSELGSSVESLNTKEERPAMADKEPVIFTFQDIKTPHPSTSSNESESCNFDSKYCNQSNLLHSSVSSNESVSPNIFGKHMKLHGSITSLEASLSSVDSYKAGNSAFKSPTEIPNNVFSNDETDTITDIKDIDGSSNDRTLTDSLNLESFIEDCSAVGKPKRVSSLVDVPSYSAKPRVRKIACVASEASIATTEYKDEQSTAPKSNLEKLLSLFHNPFSRLTEGSDRGKPEGTPPRKDSQSNVSNSAASFWPWGSTSNPVKSGTVAALDNIKKYKESFEGNLPSLSSDSVGRIHPFVSSSVSTEYTLKLTDKTDKQIESSDSNLENTSLNFKSTYKAETDTAIPGGEKKSFFKDIASTVDNFFNSPSDVLLLDDSPPLEEPLMCEIDELKVSERLRSDAIALHSRMPGDLLRLQERLSLTGHSPTRLDDVNSQNTSTASDDLPCKSALVESVDESGISWEMPTDRLPEDVQSLQDYNDDSLFDQERLITADSSTMVPSDQAELISETDVISSHSSTEEESIKDEECIPEYVDVDSEMALQAKVESSEHMPDQSTNDVEENANDSTNTDDILLVDPVIDEVTDVDQQSRVISDIVSISVDPSDRGKDVEEVGLREHESIEKLDTTEIKQVYDIVTSKETNQVDECQDNGRILVEDETGNVTELKSDTKDEETEPVGRGFESEVTVSSGREDGCGPPRTLLLTACDIEERTVASTEAKVGQEGARTSVVIQDGLSEYCDKDGSNVDAELVDSIVTPVTVPHETSLFKDNLSFNIVQKDDLLFKESEDCDSLLSSVVHPAPPTHKTPQGHFNHTDLKSHEVAFVNVDFTVPSHLDSDKSDLVDKPQHPKAEIPVRPTDFHTLNNPQFLLSSAQSGKGHGSVLKQSVGFENITSSDRQLSPDSGPSISELPIKIIERIKENISPENTLTSSMTNTQALALELKEKRTVLGSIQTDFSPLKDGKSVMELKEEKHYEDICIPSEVLVCHFQEESQWMPDTLSTDISKQNVTSDAISIATTHASDPSTWDDLCDKTKMDNSLGNQSDGNEQVLELRDDNKEVDSAVPQTTGDDTDGIHLTIEMCNLQLLAEECEAIPGNKDGYGSQVSEDKLQVFNLKIDDHFLAVCDEETKIVDFDVVKENPNIDMVSDKNLVNLDAPDNKLSELQESAKYIETNTATELKYKVENKSTFEKDDTEMKLDKLEQDPAYVEKEDISDQNLEKLDTFMVKSDEPESPSRESFKPVSILKKTNPGTLSSQPKDIPEPKRQTFSHHPAKKSSFEGKKRQKHRQESPVIRCGSLPENSGSLSSSPRSLRDFDVHRKSPNKSNISSLGKMARDSLYALNMSVEELDDLRESGRLASLESVRSLGSVSEDVDINSSGNRPVFSELEELHHLRESNRLASLESMLSLGSVSEDAQSEVSDSPGNRFGSSDLNMSQEEINDLKESNRLASLESVKSLSSVCEDPPHAYPVNRSSSMVNRASFSVHNAPLTEAVSGSLNSGLDSSADSRISDQSVSTESLLSHTSVPEVSLQNQPSVSEDKLVVEENS